jgi:hypothetical protein
VVVVAELACRHHGPAQRVVGAGHVAELGTGDAEPGQ